MLQLEITGHIGSDAVVKELNGQKFIAFNVANTESYKDAAGTKHERTTWVSCLKYGESAILNYLKKGTHVFVRGDLYTKLYEGKNGPAVAVNCKVAYLELLSGSRTEGSAAQEPKAAPAAGSTQTKSEEDELPF